MANLYTVESLLVGKTYRSNSITGEIISAEKDPKGTWYGDNTESYLVSIYSNGRNTYRTLAVKIGE